MSGSALLANRRVVLGVTGGVAAYKAVLLCRLLTEAGAIVSPVLTANAQRFVGRATFDALASEPAKTSLFDDADPSPHTTLGQNADVVVVAPATARVIGSYAAGISDGLLTATLLATRAPVVVCPAMHTEMWEHPAVQANMAVLVERGTHIVPPESGALAAGDSGTGRLAEPEQILRAITDLLGRAPGSGDLAGRSVVVTAGGTREAIDPVRFVGNRSSGRQGHALARAAAARGAKVCLITTSSEAVAPGVASVAVNSAAEMNEAVERAAGSADVVLMAAAVADFAPVGPASQKIKKADGPPVLTLEPTIDILAGLGERKPPGQVLVGFAAETQDVLANGAAKLTAKRADLLVVNDVSAPGVGFEHDTNAVTILRADGSHRDVPLASKFEVANVVLDEVAKLLAPPQGPPSS